MIEIMDTAVLRTNPENKIVFTGSLQECELFNRETTRKSECIIISKKRAEKIVNKQD